MTNTMDTAPSFVSAKAADVILSDVRPTSISPDALRAVNILLDELLWLILAHTRSLETSRLKSGVLKAIPTQLGKDAILEAEIEIRAYRDKAQSRSRVSRPADDANATFPLQEAFDYLRYKGQVLSSFGDVEEDLFIEERLLEGYRSASSIPAAQEITDSAPLYVTAVIEHVSQHLLSNIARVVARDSSRTSADLQNLFTSLCEDSLIYPVFKDMKVQSHIAQHLQLSQSSGLTRKKSVSSANQLTTPSASSTSTTSNGSRGVPPSSFSRSSDGGNPAAGHPSSSAPNPRTGSSSRQRNRSPGRVNGSRTSHESRRGTAPNGTLQRSLSLMSGGHVSERAASVDATSVYSSKMTVFDELLESGDTMKVSLTPDRMKTFDVTKDKSGRATTNAASSLSQSTPAIAQTDRLPPTPITTSDLKQNIVPADSIPTSAVSYRGNTTPPAAIPISSVYPSSPNDTSRRARPRESEVPPVPPLPRGPTTPQKNASGSDVQQSYATRSYPAPSAPSVAFPGIASGSGGGSPLKKNRATGRARNRDSLDLDDIMNGDDDMSESELVQTNNPPRLAVPRAELSASTSTSSVNRSMRGVKVSQTAQELMDFLDSGPPAAPGGSSEPSDNPLSLSVSSKKSGRFMNMVSRLRRGSSTEKMLTRPRSFERLGSSASRRGTSSAKEISSPKVVGAPGQLLRHRSQHNLSTIPRAPPSSWTQPLPTPPKPPTPPQPAPLQLVPPPQQQTASSRATLDPPKRNAVAAIEPSPLPSPVSIQFGRGGNRNVDGNEDEAVESLPVSTLSRSASLRPKQTPGTVLEQMGNDTFAGDGGKNTSLSRSPTRKPPPTQGLDESAHISSSPPTTGRSPTRKASRDAAVAAASAAMAAGIGETFQPTPPVNDNPKAVRRPYTPTSPTVDARDTPIAETQRENEPEPVSANTVDTPAPESRASTSPTPSTTPSSLGDDLAERAAELRRMLAAAKHVEEARLLVDMFLIQMGLTMPSNDDSILRDQSPRIVTPERPLCPDSFVVTTEVERTIVEILLGDSDAAHAFPKEALAAAETELPSDSDVA